MSRYDYTKRLIIITPIIFRHLRSILDKATSRIRFAIYWEIPVTGFSRVIQNDIAKAHAFKCVIISNLFKNINILLF